jgi:hypothetical protein
VGDPEIRMGNIIIKKMGLSSQIRFMKTATYAIAPDKRDKSLYDIIFCHSFQPPP